MYRLRKQIKVMVMAVLVLAGVILCDTAVQAASADNSLSSLKLSEGTLSPSFAYNVVNYKATVGSDVSSIEVSARTSNATATIKSGTGTHSLTEGVNTIKIVVEAENGNLATYTIKVTREEGAGTPADDTANETTPENNENTGNGDTAEGTETVPTVLTGADGYTVAEKIPETEIPSGFTQTTISYQDAECAALKFDKGDITLLYMENEQKEGMLFLYDAATATVYPFVKLSAGENYLMLLPAPADAGLGENYVPAELTISNKSVPAAFQSVVANTPDFYQVYGMNSEGAAGWYQYDKAEGTYQRYQEVTAEETDVTSNEEYQFLQNAYEELSKKYSALKQRDTKYMAGLIIAIAVLLIIIVNLLLFKREKAAERAENESGDIFDEDVIIRKSEKKAAKKEEKKERFFERDADDFTDFDEEPEFMTGGKEKPEKKEKKKRFSRRDDIFDEGEKDDFFDEEAPFEEKSVKDIASLDDDLEILDLNDL